jgi:hypothetical protein
MTATVGGESENVPVSVAWTAETEYIRDKGSVNNFLYLAMESGCGTLASEAAPTKWEWPLSGFDQTRAGSMARCVYRKLFTSSG